MPKITLLGAGSGFMQPLFTDILNIEGLDRGIIGLVDIDARRLEISVRLMRKVLDQTGKQAAWTIHASTDRREVLKGTDYLISTIEVSGVQCVRFDNDIPRKYGIDQCIGDTIGPGGIMKALRTLPPFVEILADARRFCPRALIMNYTNPMSIMTLGAIRSTPQPIVGLCHSVQGSSRQLAHAAGVPYEQMEWTCGGINHMAWFTTLKWRGQDLYPVLRTAIEDRAIYERDPVRFDIMKHFGYFVTESSGHFSEYVPYYRKRADVMKKFCRDGYLGGSSFYANSWPGWRKAVDRKRTAMMEGKMPIPLARGYEYASDIIEAHLFDRKKVIYASVANTNLIPNLPLNGVVEVAVLVDREGYTPTYFGPLPEQVAALCRANMAVFELCVQGILGKDREAVIRAMMLDPLSAAVCSPEQIRAMAEALFRAEKHFIPDWCAKPKAVAPRARLPMRALTRFHVVGPFENAGDDGESLGLTQALPPEEKLDLKARYAGKRGKRIGWKRVAERNVEFNGFVNLSVLLGQVDMAVAYASTVLVSDRAQTIDLLVGSDDGIAVWLNGRPVAAIEATRASDPAQNSVRLPLRRGRNRLLLKIDQKVGGWGFFAHLPDEATGVQVLFA